MGYACPVCGDPQADPGHLANHLAMTAVLRGGDHEAWLDDHVEDWGEMDEAELAPLVSAHATETEYPQVFEDTTESTGAGDEEAADRAGRLDSTGADALPGAEDLPAEFLAGGDGDDEPSTAEILERARALTEQQRAEESETE